MSRMAVSLLKIPGMSFLTRQPIAYALAVMGISVSFTDFPPLVKYPVAILAILILITVLLIKYEDWREKRADRLNSEDAREIMEELQERADRVEGVSPVEIKQAFDETRN